VLSKNTIKRITRLRQKKYRASEGLFIAEGIKVISDLLLSACELQELFSTEEDLFVNKNTQVISTQELKKISFLTTPQKALAVFKIPRQEAPLDKGLSLVLDNVRDPGNLGTIIRLCDWFGVQDLICSEETVDCYNPKVVQATMGSIARVNVHYINLVPYLSQTKRTVYGTFMDGDDVYKSTLTNEAIVVMGNEGKGITDEVASAIKQRLSIPRFGKIQETESLNVAMATSIFLSEFKR
jgi:TrmH family RNA methyltransferase